MKGAPLDLVILTADTVDRRSEAGVVAGAKIITDQSFFNSPLLWAWGALLQEIPPFQTKNPILPEKHLGVPPGRPGGIRTGLKVGEGAGMKKSRKGGITPL